jgi:hypothetical protein
VFRLSRSKIQETKRPKLTFADVAVSKVISSSVKTPSLAACAITICITVGVLGKMTIDIRNAWFAQPHGGRDFVFPGFPGNKTAAAVTIRATQGSTRQANSRFDSSCINFVKSTTTLHHGDSETNSGAGPGSYMFVGFLPIPGLWTCKASTTIKNYGSGTPS